MWRRFKRDRVAMASIAFLVILLIAVCPGSWIAENFRWPQLRDGDLLSGKLSPQ